MTRVPALILIVASLTCGTVFAQAAMAWQKTPMIVAVGQEADARFELVDEAVAYWNRSLEEIGSALRLPVPKRLVLPVPDQALVAMSRNLMRGEWSAEVPQELKDLPGDLTVFLANAEFISFAGPFIAPDKRIVGIRSTDRPPLNLPNVAPNLIAHELGHAIGLGHNADPAMLMCGRPAPCRPDGYRSEVPRMFPLSDDDKRQLLRMYPPDWKPEAR